MNEPYRRKRLQTGMQILNEWFGSPGGSDQFLCGIGEQKWPKSRQPLIWILPSQWFGKRVLAL